MTKRILAVLTLGLVVIGAVVAVYFLTQDTTPTSKAPVTIKTPTPNPIDNTVNGVVMTLGGRPLPGAAVTATSKVAEDSVEEPRVITVKANKEGAFEFKALPAGAWRLDAASRGFISPGPEAMRGLTVTVGANKKVPEIELVLRRPVRLRGRVVAAGAPIDGANVGLFYQFADGVGGPLKNFALERVATTNKDGYFDIKNAAPGRFRILAEHTGYEMAQSGELFLRQGRDAKNLLIDLAPAASLVFEVVSPKGDPLRATVTLNSKNLLQPIQQQANAKGMVRFDRLSAGQYTVSARLSGFFSETIKVDAVANKLGQHDLIMNKSSGLFGRVIFPDEAKNPFAFVVLMNADGKRVRTLRARGKEGIFQLENVPKAVESIQAVSPSFGPSKTLAVTLGKEMVLTVNTGGRIKGKVVTTAGKALANYSIAVVDMKIEGPRVFGPRYVPVKRVRDAAGAFEMGPLAPGSYTLSVRPSKGYANALSETIVVRSGQDVQGVVITVGEGATVNGVVTDAEGPVAGARVSLFEISSRFRPSFASTDKQGQFTLKNVQAGRQSLRVSKRGYLTQIVAGVETSSSGTVTRNVSLEKAKPGERFAFHGIGASLQKTDKGVVIQNVMKDMPAQTYGLKAKDVITSVDGEDTSDMRLSDVIKRIRGEEGVAVSIEVEREGEGRMTIDVERGRVVVKSRRGRN